MPAAWQSCLTSRMTDVADLKAELFADIIPCTELAQSPVCKLPKQKGRHLQPK